MKNKLIVTFLILISANVMAQNNAAVVYDSEFDFAALKTFCFSESSKKLKEELGGNSQLGKALATQIVKIGGSIVESESEADAIIDLAVGFKDKIDIEEQTYTIYSRYYGASRFKERYINAGSVTDIEEGFEARLVMNIIDIKSDETVWTAIWLGKPNFDEEPEEIKDRIKESLENVFKKYPVD